MARTRVARTRLSTEESAILEAKVKDSGVSESEYLRRLILNDQALEPRLQSIERRLEHLEEQVAHRWLQEDRHGQQVT